MADIAKKAKINPDKPALAGVSRLTFFLWNCAWEVASETAAGNANALHDMRVALRRLRSCLQNFEGDKSTPVLSSSLRKELKVQRAEVGKIGDALGAVRDHDVLDEYLKTYFKTQLKNKTAEISAEEFPGLFHFEQFLKHERESAFAPMQKRLNKAQKPGGLREEFARWALGIPAALATEKTLRKTANELLPLRESEVLALSKTLDDSDDEIGHHEFRKALRRVRYTLETLGPCFDLTEDEIKARLKTLVDLQDVLGEMQDRSVLREKVLVAFKNKSGENKIDDSKTGKKSHGEYHLPEDIQEFLDYGQKRKRFLLGKARGQWRKVKAD